jgi:hypothetical protein
MCTPVPILVFVQPCRGGGNDQIRLRLCDAILLCGLIVAERTLVPGLGDDIP